MVKPVLKGHLWARNKWPYKTGDLIKKVSIHIKLFMPGP